MNTINIDSHKVETNDSVICGSNNVVFGNNNKIYGNSNKVYGNNNAVVGNDNIVKGEDNKAEGTGNEVSTPFGSFSPAPSAPSTSSPTVSQPSISRNAPMNSYPTTGRARSNTFPMAAPTNYPMETYPSPYSNTMVPANYAMVAAPYSTQAYSQAIVPVAMPTQQAYPMVPYINPFSGPTQVPAPTVNPFGEHKSKEKEVDLIQDGTMVFMIKEWESDYIREFCQLVAMNSGQKVGWHVSCGRTCVVGLGDLEKIRRAIIDLLPQLNMRLRDWSWNSFGNKVCSDREVFEKRLFKEYKKEDVECWRNNTPSSPPSASKAAA